MGTDTKYGKVTTEHGEIPEDEPVIVNAGSPPRHIELIGQTRDRFTAWQEANPDKMRVPDSERSREWMG